jgi:hypothetical protein
MNEPSKKNEEGSAAPAVMFSTVSVICICATIAFVAYLNSPRPEARRLWKPLLIDTNGNSITLPESRQLEFWTPSAKTKDYLHTEKGEVVPTETWQALSNDDPVMQFGNVLHTNSYVLGYRRVEAWGQGTTIYKPGWWWTVNVYTNYTANDLARTYESFWKSHQVVFIEEIDNRGIADK